MWGMTPGQITVYADTESIDLATRRVDKTVTKVVSFPHIMMLVTGTGLYELIARWSELVARRSGRAHQNIDLIDEIAPDTLRDLWEGIDDRPDVTSTIYHFGWSPSQQRLIGLAYRSVSDFESEQIEDGFAVKPPPSDPDWDGIDDLGELVELAETIRAEQAADPEGLHIGGSLIATSMIPIELGLEYLTATIHHFA